jgi:hypothetical protein
MKTTLLFVPVINHTLQVALMAFLAILPLLRPQVPIWFPLLAVVQLLAAAAAIVIIIISLDDSKLSAAALKVNEDSIEFGPLMYSVVGLNGFICVMSLVLLILSIVHLVSSSKSKNSEGKLTATVLLISSVVSLAIAGLGFISMPSLDCDSEGCGLNGNFGDFAYKVK